MEEIIEKIYKRKIIDEILKYLYEKEVIILYGARQVGKTFILYWLKNFLQEKKEQVYYLDLEERRYLEILNQGPENLKKLLLEEGFDLKKRVFVLIDEIQYLDNPTNFLKLITDHEQNLKLIVSGSSTFEIKKKIDKALVGRALIFEIFGLSFEESLIFKGYQKPLKPVLTKIKEEELKELFTEFVLYGSYPKISLIPEKEKKEKYLWQIIDTYLKKDIRDLAEIKEIEKFNKLLEVLASQTGKLLNIEELSNTCRLAKQTVEKYLFILENTYVIRLVRPFFKNLRSELFKTPKIYFYDSGLAHLLWLKVISPEILGEIFETVIFSELVKNFGKESVNFWRTKGKKEIDFILKYKNEIIPIETKVNFASFLKRPIDYFLEKYKIKQYYLVGLKGDKPKEGNFLYPWQTIENIKND
ncbi:ATP-binding protein [Patescibacteria group bacterium]|nr:ATP-binding protein [Patescibacteria group bacterium]MBU4481133.1 ATP-binding protein [Patescibacteria group bacterium]